MVLHCGHSFLFPCDGRRDTDKYAGTALALRGDDSDAASDRWGCDCRMELETFVGLTPENGEMREGEEGRECLTLRKGCGRSLFMPLP
ncbi:hypothetical protein EYF80_043081 [Liparis tanakae]|uniref:Uncharacterized protein n=1 Tax=Liparis tanakae TaxID=230148 RepID=A0A4Z2G2I4_9TELE|nr:hypothetical protein EYF80_043081 [Liparis tanakae]